jgi:hypothetical protein
MINPLLPSAGCDHRLIRPRADSAPLPASQAADGSGNLLAQIAQRFAHRSHGRLGGFVSRRLGQIRFLKTDGFSCAVHDAPTDPQLDDLLGVELKAEHCHLDLIHGLLASFPRVSDNSVGLKQD